MTDYALIYQFTDRGGSKVYYRYDLEDSKTRNEKLGEIRIPPETDINDRIAEDWGEQKQA